MKVLNADILEVAKLPTTDAICFTSNGVVKKDGALVMGAGVAKIIRDAYPGVDKQFGQLVKSFGNKPFFQNQYKPAIINYPTKNHWQDNSDIHLIIESAKRLQIILNKFNLNNVYLPSPGVGLGGLNWNDVKSAIENILDDRITILFK